MSLTIGNWVVIAIISIIGIVFGGFCLLDNKKAGGIAAILGTIIIDILLIFVLNWVHTSTASGIRNYKDYTSNLSNGIEREITITAEDGRQIYHYEGKVDIESDHSDNYIKFEREDGGREIIYYGVTDTVIITEIQEK